MQRLEVSGAVRLIYKSLGVKGLNIRTHIHPWTHKHTHTHTHTHKQTHAKSVVMCRYDWRNRFQCIQRKYSRESNFILYVPWLLAESRGGRTSLLWSVAVWMQAYSAVTCSGFAECDLIFCCLFC